MEEVIVDSNTDKRSMATLFITHLALFMMFVAAQMILLLTNTNEWTLKLASLGLLFLVIFLNWVIIKIFKPVKREWHLVVHTSGVAATRLLFVGSAVAVFWFWPEQYRGWNEVGQFIGEVGLFLLLMVVIAWLVSVWLGVKLYQLVMYKLGEYTIEGKTLFHFDSSKPSID